jgi:hypothetical protein
LKGEVAKLAFSIHHIHLEDIKVCPVYDPLIAGRAEGGITNMAWDIPDIDIFQIIFLCDLISRFQG